MASNIRADSRSAPFFSIGLTTYNRRELLKQTLASIIRQTFVDFEVIVGNDDTREALSTDLLGIDDSRIRIVNQTTNLGEVANMNSLLRMSRGRYFTWLADDDLYAPVYLQAVHSALQEHGFPSCVFTSYVMGTVFPRELEQVAEVGSQLLNGREFLQRFLAKSLSVLGCYGVFESQYLRRLGGMESHGNGFSPYSDLMLGIRSGLLEKLVYIDSPLVFFRTHEGSISYTSKDLGAYSSAQQALCHKSVEVFRSNNLSDDFHFNLYLLLQWCFSDFATVARRRGSISARQGASYLHFAGSYLRLLRGSGFWWKAISILIKTSLSLVRGMVRAKLSRLLAY